MKSFVVTLLTWGLFLLLWYGAHELFLSAGRLDRRADRIGRFESFRAGQFRRARGPSHLRIFIRLIQRITVVRQWIS